MRIVLDGRSLTLEQVAQAAAGGARIELAQPARERVRAARQLVDRIAESGVPTYGVNTGFGTLAEVPIARPDLRKLQRNLIHSHSAGVGAPLPPPAVRALMLLRANVLAGGYSGIRESTLDLLVTLLERDVIPVIPEKGSVGASGDLAPLAHLALVLIGEGEAIFEGKRIPGAQALAAAGLGPVVLEAKEGLALVNGTQAMQAVGIPALLEAERLARLADIACAGTRGRRWWRASCGRCSPRASSTPATRGRTARRCRTRTRCAALHKYTAPRATRSPSRAARWKSNATPPPTTRWCSRAATAR